MKNLRIVFMGTPDFAVHILAKILETKHEITGVVTAPDKPAGRGQKLLPSAVKKFAVKNKLDIYQPTNLKSDSFQEDLKKMNPDLIVVVAFRMLPKKIWNFPKYGTFNLHASLLPDYRGAAPIQWAIINGETSTGITTFFLDENIDTGNIISKEEVTIQSEDTAGILHDKLMHLGGDLVVKTLTLIAEGKAKPIPQPQADSLKKAPKLDRENTRIDWTASPEEIKNLIRGLNPFPGAWTFFKNGKKELRCKILQVEIHKKAHQLSYGAIETSKTELKVAVPSGFIRILEMQMPGKRKMEIREILNGFHLKEDAHMH